MKNDSDSERDEVLCLNSDHLENVCSRGRDIDNDIKNFEVILIYFYENNTSSLWKMQSGKEEKKDK